jgi:DNA-binding beta-propeller fold protein YncE
MKDPHAARASGTVAAAWLSMLMLAGVAGPPAATGKPAHLASAFSRTMTSTRIAVGAAPRSVPGCTTVTARAPRLASVGTSMTRVPGTPFGVVGTHDGMWDLVSLGSFLGVLRNTSAGPVLVHRVRLPAGNSARGEALTPGGRYLLAAWAGGANVLNVSTAEQGRPGAVIGTLSGGPGLTGAFEDMATAGGRFAFVTIAGSASVAVFDLRRALASGFGPADFVGTIPVGRAPLGMAMSPDGRWLYVASERAAPAARHGTLSVISVRTAETDPAAAVVATADAGCEPVRVTASADGEIVWVTARGSNALLGFSAGRLISDPRHALISWLRVGEEPIGLAIVDRGSRIVVADSDRFRIRGASATLAIVDVPAALAGRPALLGYLRAGLFPREMAVVPGAHTLLVDNYRSRQIESVNLAELP